MILRMSTEDKAFNWLLVAVSAAFALIIWPLFGAVLWAVVFAIVCAPVFRWLRRAFRGRGSLAAATTLVLILVVVIVPTILVTASIVREASALYERIKSGGLGNYVQGLFDLLPAWVTRLLEQLGMPDIQSVQSRITESLAKASQFMAVQALNVGQNTLEFIVSLGVMLYLLFFLLRDGEALYARLRGALP